MTTTGCQPVLAALIERTVGPQAAEIGSGSHFWAPLGTAKALDGALAAWAMAPTTKALHGFIGQRCRGRPMFDPAGT